MFNFKNYYVKLQQHLFLKPISKIFKKSQTFISLERQHCNKNVLIDEMASRKTVIIAFIVN